MGKTATRLGQVIVLLWANLVFAHPFHSSYAELDWAESGKTLQVSLRVIPEELETALTQHAGRNVVLGTNSADQELISDYLSNHFRLSNSSNSNYRVNYLGGEVSHDETWLHFSVHVDTSTALTLQNTVLMAQNPTQVNRVRFLWLEDSTDLVFNRERTSAIIPAKKQMKKNLTDTITVTR